jgi:crossover junction endodeoxyribonuclease RuvC
MRVLGIDPGYDRLGIAIVERVEGVETLVHSACIETDKTQELSDRLFFLGEELEQILTTYTPDVVGVETIFFNKNQKTAIGVAQARGIILFLAKKHGCIVREFGPQEIKVAVTGYGKSDKHAVISMTKRLLKNVPEGKLDDEYDAIAVGVTCLAHHTS